MPLALWIGATHRSLCIRSGVLRGTARLRLLGGYGTMFQPGTSMCYPRRDTAQGLRLRSLLALLKRQPVRVANRTWRAGFAATAGTSCAGLRERWHHDLSLC